MSAKNIVNNHIPSELKKILSECNAKDLGPLQKYHDSLVGEDPCFAKDAINKHGQKYRVLLAHLVAPKVIESWESYFKNEYDYPFIDITLKAARDGIKTLSGGDEELGSPQDFLYGFTADRYPNWPASIIKMGFQSAVMHAQGCMRLLICGRFLELSKPDVETDEIQGAIDNEFLQSVKILFGKESLEETLHSILTYYQSWDLIESLWSGKIEKRIKSIRKVKTFLESKKHPTEPLYITEKIPQINQELNRLLDQEKAKPIPKPSTDFSKISVSTSQEQIALKYMEEGKFLQKVFGGQKFDHVQSNVKGVKNNRTGSHAEVDSIYRASGQKHIVLVEAKGKLRVSKTQLFNIYETYRLKSPPDWKIDVVSLTISNIQGDEKYSTQIDLALIDFDDTFLGKPTESILHMSVKKHNRWKIRR